MSDTPLSIVVDDDMPVRRDTVSEDMERVHPEVKHLRTSRERTQHLIKCDMKAYEDIAFVFPELGPPNRL
jgi:hypothetical protein